ncbi:unnamed protein product [Heligmosomoides polygyrus]|uniref:C2H2-type domain-containing protein n=1 Tax=Heligmosomoides polygyrus TaxID=6339 RepID=A0A3P7YHS2_HELPZ|nr:unnamed protein product [Heligmosomoides polygyrus]
MVKFWFCELCDMRHANTASLIKHMREDHHCEEEFVARNPNFVENFSESCPSCDTRVLDVAELLAHATLVHEFVGVVRREVFPSFVEFEQWKERVEDESISTWVKRRRKTTGNVLTLNLRCHRNLETDVTSVEYCLEHFGHEQDPLKQSLPWSLKLEIAEMLKQNMFARDIVRTLKWKNINERKDGVCMLKRQYWVTERDVYRVASDLRAHPHKYEKMEGVSPDPSGVSTAPEFIKAEPCSSSSSILESLIEREPSPMRNACPEEALFKADHDPAERSAVHRKRLKKEEPCSAFSIAEVIPGAELGPTVSGSPKVLLKIDSDPNSAESSSGTERLFFKEEPISVTTLLQESSSNRMELSSEDAKPPTDEGVRVFSLAVAPDGKGFALVNHSSCVDVAHDDL